MAQFYAQPYDISATGFYFESIESYDKQAKTLTNACGHPVEEFEIQFIDGEQIDCELAKAWSINQANLESFFQAVEGWDDHEKTTYIIAIGECGYAHQQVIDDLDLLDIDIYHIDSLSELAEQFVDDGLFGDIPERLRFYIDYDAIARDLSVEYTETNINGDRLVYRIG